jgi:hypothetical protein
MRSEKQKAAKGFFVYCRYCGKEITDLRHDCSRKEPPVCTTAELDAAIARINKRGGKRK